MIKPVLGDRTVLTENLVANVKFRTRIVIGQFSHYFLNETLHS